MANWVAGRAAAAHQRRGPAARPRRRIRRTTPRPRWCGYEPLRCGAWPPCCSCSCSPSCCNADLRAVRRRGRPSQPEQATAARCCDEYSRERGPISSGRLPSPQSIPTNDQLKYLRTYSVRPALRARHRVLLARLRRDRDRAAPRTRSSPAPTTGSSSTGVEQLFAGRNVQGGAVRADAQRQGPAGRVRRSRRPYRCGRRDRPADRRHPRAGHVALVRPEQAQRPRHHRDARTAYQAYDADPAKPLTNRPLTMTCRPGRRSSS